jgi:hypothetical protein
MQRLLCLLAALAAGSAQAWDCKYEKELDVGLSLAGSDKLTVVAAAGDLEIVGHAGTSEARVRGRVCASTEEWLEQAELITEGGRNASITVSLPDSGNGWSWSGSQYVYMDLEIHVPATLALDIHDSSGDVEIEGAGSVTLQDSSGDIDFSEVGGDFVVERDSSGDIVADTIGGDFQVLRDGSGEIRSSGVTGEVDIPDQG